MNPTHKPFAVPSSFQRKIVAFTSPPSHLQCRMQLGAMDRLHSYSGPLDCLRQVVRSEGLAGLARGLGGTMAREMPGNAIYFSSYEVGACVPPSWDLSVDQCGASSR